MNSAPRPDRHAIAASRTSRGIALLGLLGVLILVAAGFLMSSAGSSPRPRLDNEAHQSHVLALAKKALLAYAVSTDNPAAAFRPGSLPCPDVDNDGVRSITPPDQNGANCGSELGWLPYVTLDIPELRDASGSRLWYAVSRNFRSNAAIVRNSETAGAISVDGAGDIVAVVIAPGQALDGQFRPLPGEVFDATRTEQRGAFLEDQNASGDLQTFTRTSAGLFNDQLIVITRAELMRAVEQRVVGEVAASLRAYSASWGGTAPVFPWFKTYEDPLAAADFHGTAGQSEGLLPMHDPDGGDETFASPWTLDWSNLDTIPDFAFGTVTVAMLQSGPPGGLAIPQAGSTCAWFAAQPGRSRCSGALQSDLGLLTYLGFPVISSTRSYVFTNIDVSAADVNAPSAVAAPTADEVRTRAVSVTPGSGSFGAGGRIDIREDVVIDVLGDSFALTIGIGRLTTNAATGGTMTLAGVRYWLDPARELPAWFAANQWHRLIYAAASPAYLGGGSLDCTASGNCLTLVALGGVAGSNQVGLGVISAGATLAALGQDRAGGAAPLSAYLEQENAEAGDARLARRGYDVGAVTPFNDQARVMLRADLL